MNDCCLTIHMCACVCVFHPNCFLKRDTAGDARTNVLLWTPTHGPASVCRSAGTYLHQFYADTGCSLEDLPEAMDDRDRWGERELGKSALSLRLDDDNEIQIIMSTVH